MRKFIEIINEAIETSVLDKIGSASLSRATDPEEQIEFKVFCDAGAAHDTKAMLAKFPIRYEISRNATKLTKYAFVCTGTRETAETLTRKLKMSKILAVVRID